METAIVRRVAFAELADAPTFASLCAEYAQESANADLAGRAPDHHAYAGMEAAGVAHFLGVFRGEELVGFACLLVTPVPHFKGRLIGTTESIFVAAAHRPGGAGMALLRATEALARDLGATGLYVSGPAEGRLVQLLPAAGYRETNRTFYRGLHA
ncbi:GNAT family N-acetyltransferase [Bordetella bronchiseptica]|uniref:GNAT family N-acetyltransferase n=1 Tax=Bordetella bronchiseptica TaxID=518 RepID=UPI0039FBFEA7